MSRKQCTTNVFDCEDYTSSQRRILFYANEAFHVREVISKMYTLHNGKHRPCVYSLKINLPVCACCFAFRTDDVANSVP